MKKKDFLIILLICFLWGMDFIFAKQALEVLHPSFFTSMRFMIVGLALLPFITKKVPKEIPNFILAGIMMVVISYGLTDLSNKLNDSTMVLGTLGQLDTILAILMGYFVFKESFTKRSIIGVFLAGFGLISLGVLNVFFDGAALDIESLISNKSLDYENLLSIVFIFLGLFGWPGYIFFTKKISSKIKSLDIVGWTSLFGSIILFIITFIFNEKSFLSKNFQLLFEPKVFFQVLYGGLLGILVPNFLWQDLTKKYDISKLNTFVLIAPIITSFASIIFLKQEINIWIVLSISLIIFGIMISSFERKKSKHHKEIF